MKETKANKKMNEHVDSGNFFRSNSGLSVENYGTYLSGTFFIVFRSFAVRKKIAQADRELLCHPARNQTINETNNNI